MVWLVPAALLGLFALAGPVLVHLLQRRRTRHVVFPSVRFVEAAEQSSARFTNISDPALLAVRAAIIASAVLALAQPLLLTRTRTEAWSKRIARVVIVDTSDSARGSITSEAISAEMSGSDYVTRMDTDDPGAAVKRATAWLEAAPPARREIVILSDFQRGSLRAKDVAEVPSGVGLRLVEAQRPPRGQRGPSIRVLSDDGVLRGETVLDGPRTSVTYSPESAATAGLQILAAPGVSISALTSVVAGAGAAAPDPDEPIIVRFPGAPAAAPSAGEVNDWTFGAAQRLLKAVREIDVPVSVRSSRGTLIVDVEADPGSLAAARVVQAALDSRIDPDASGEAEPESIPGATLSEWARPAAPPDPAKWRGTEDSDGRWLWVVVLVLLGIEAIVRRSLPARGERVEAHDA